ncbi:MAG: hypothetical protein HC796_03210 [Synechococcaceae cyanobacterium RL_1_2]|nr:hypothetical protein [Synechococcaceae cyanobacterium RL_1_2]
MIKHKKLFEFFAPFHTPGSTILLFLLSVTDMVFVVLYWFLIWKLLERSEFDLTRDFGFAEMYQYIKEFWCILLATLLLWKTKEKSYLSWILMLVYILLDDSMRIHETLGKVIGRQLNFVEIFGIRNIDVGEFAVFAIAGIVTIGLISICFKHGSKLFKQLTLDLFLFIALLVFFGVIVDVVHIVINENTIGKVFGTIEDYGEMLGITLITWYLFLHNIHSNPMELSLVRTLGKIYKNIFSQA